MDNWNDLSLKEKADVMKIAISNGIYNLSDIRKTYNEYAEGGPKNNGNPRPITTGGAGYVPSSSSNVQIFNKEKIYNRVLPTEMTGANTGPLDSVKQYLFNNDRAVDEWFEDYVPYINNSYGDAIEASRILNDLYKKAGTEKEQESLENSPTMKALMYQNLAPEMFVQEHGKDTYLGMPQRFGTMRDAEYHPVNGKLVNGKYVSYMRDPIFVDTEIIPTYQNYMMGITRKDNPESNVQRVTKNGNALVYMPFLNNATMSKGYDPNRGEYISIYDDWDYNTAVLGKAGDNISKFIGGQPFSIYDRYYLDDIFDVPKDKRGSYYLPEVTVTPDKKSTGGPLITLANEFSKGGKIHIKPSHRGKFTRLKERTGHSASWFKENGTPAQKKMATFELNARKWKHGDGGPLIDLANRYAEGGPYKPGTIYGRPVEEGLKIVSPEFDALLIGKAAANAAKEAAGELLNSGIEGTARQRAAITSRRFGREMTKRSNEVKGWSRTLMDDIKDGNYADVPLDLKGLTRNVWETGRYIKNTPERYVENTLPKFYRNVFRRTYNNIKPAVPMIFKDNNDE